MAKFIEPTAEQISLWRDWVAQRPPVIQELARRFDPWTLYLLKESGHRVTVFSFVEDGTLTVNVLGEFNRVAFERRVFGIPPDQLEECDLPAEGELLGTAFTPEEAEVNIDALRVMVRPDLWRMGAGGKAERKH